MSTIHEHRTVENWIAALVCALVLTWFLLIASMCRIHRIGTVVCATLPTAVPKAVAPQVEALDCPVGPSLQQQIDSLNKQLEALEAKK